MKNPTRVYIADHVRNAFDQIYQDYRGKNYGHSEALKATRDDLIDIAEGEAKARTASAQGFWSAIGQGIQNSGEMLSLDNQINALIVEKL